MIKPCREEADSWCSFPFRGIPAGGASSYILAVTTCADCDVCGTGDGGMTFEFCQGGSYCDTEDYIVGTTSSDKLTGETMYLSVTPGYVPTTAKIVNRDIDGW